MKLRAVIFDLDGTLGDTLPVCYAAFRETFEQFLGRSYADQEIAAMFGPSEEGVFQRMVPDRWEACMEAFLAAYERVHAEHARAFPGLEAALRLLKERGLALGIVTGKGPRSAAISLRHLGLAGYFDAVEAGHAGGGSKPEAIRKVLDGWGIGPEDAIYIGDLTYDINAARKAGVTPLGAAWSPTANAERLEAAAPLAVFRSVESFARWIADNVEAGGGGMCEPG